MNVGIADYRLLLRKSFYAFLFLYKCPALKGREIGPHFPSSILSAQTALSHIFIRI